MAEEATHEPTATVDETPAAPGADRDDLAAPGSPPGECFRHELRS